MEIVTKLTAFASKLEHNGFLSLASEVDSAAIGFVKIAKELGGQGYSVQNGRCWSGCYRSKRASKPKTSAQDIWFECHEEYEKAINGSPTEWNKYAGSSSLTKTAEAKEFSQAVKSLIASGEDVGTAVYSTISNNVNDLRLKAIEAAESLINVSNSLDSRNIELSTEAASLSSMMTKEAWGLGGIGNVLAPTTNKMKGRYNANKIGRFQNLEVLLKQLQQTLQGFLKQKQQFETAVQTGVKNKTVPPELAQSFAKGLRPLSVKSVSDMFSALEKAKNQPSNEAADRLHQMTNGEQDPAELPPSDPDIHQEQNGTGAVPAATSPKNNKSPIPLENQPNQPNLPNSNEFIKNINNMPDSLKQQFKQMVDKANAMSKHTLSPMAKTNVFSLVKTAQNRRSIPQSAFVSSKGVKLPENNTEVNQNAGDNGTVVNPAAQQTTEPQLPTPVTPQEEPLQIEQNTESPQSEMTQYISSLPKNKQKRAKDWFTKNPQANVEEVKEFLNTPLPPRKQKTVVQPNITTPTQQNTTDPTAQEEGVSQSSQQNVPQQATQQNNSTDNYDIHEPVGGHEQTVGAFQRLPSQWQQWIMKQMMSSMQNINKAPATPSTIPNENNQNTGNIGNFSHTGYNINASNKKKVFKLG